MNVCHIKIKYDLTVQNISNKTILTSGDISISGLRLNDDTNLKFNCIFIYIVNYSIYHPHIRSSHCTGLFKRAVDWDIDLIQTLFCLI